MYNARPTYPSHQIPFFFLLQAGAGSGKLYTPAFEDATDARVSELEAQLMAERKRKRTLLFLSELLSKRVPQVRHGVHGACTAPPSPLICAILMRTPPPHPSHRPRPRPR